MKGLDEKYKKIAIGMVVVTLAVLIYRSKKN